MMEHTPRVDDIKGPELLHVGGIQYRAAFHCPLLVISMEPLPQRFRACDRLQVETERPDPRSHVARSERKQPAAAPDVEKREAAKVVASEQAGQRHLCLRDLPSGQVGGELQPILTEREPYSHHCSPDYT